jgi:hypothetical protein
MTSAGVAVIKISASAAHLTALDAAAPAMLVRFPTSGHPFSVRGSLKGGVDVRLVEAQEPAARRTNRHELASDGPSGDRFGVDAKQERDLFGGQQPVAGGGQISDDCHESAFLSDVATRRGLGAPPPGPQLFADSDIGDVQ